MLSLRYAFAMISIGTAVSKISTPPPYAVTAASDASVAATVPAGADEAIPITVSCVTPIASGSSRACGARIFPATAGVERSAILAPYVVVSRWARHLSRAKRKDRNRRRAVTLAVASDCGLAPHLASPGQPIPEPGIDLAGPGRRGGIQPSPRRPRSRPGAAAPAQRQGPAAWLATAQAPGQPWRADRTGRAQPASERGKWRCSALLRGSRPGRQG